MSRTLFQHVKFNINNRVLLDLAMKGVEFVNNQCPYGPVNCGDGALAKRKYYAQCNQELNLLPYGSRELHGLRAVIAFFMACQEIEKIRIDQLPPFEQLLTLARQSLRYGSGTCTEFSYIVFCYLLCMQEISPIQIITIYTGNDTHTVVALGDMSHPNYKDENIIICDPWLKLSFRLSEWNDHMVDEYRLTSASRIEIFFSSEQCSDIEKTSISSVINDPSLSDVAHNCREKVMVEVRDECRRTNTMMLGC